MPAHDMILPKFARACVLWFVVGGATAVAANEAARVGRFVFLGMTEACCDWKVEHPADQRLLYRLDSATGAIEACGDVEGVCRTVPGSARDEKAVLIGRFAGLHMAAATPAWRAKHPEDDHLLYSLDTSSGEILACGNVKGGCAVLANGTPATADPPRQVVMLYRRADSAAITGRIYDRLVARYGADAVFMDVYSIPLAVDWRQRVKKMSLEGGAIVVVIGSNWLGKLPDGHVRINDADDPVRTELELALVAHIPIFPVLVEGAGMPSAAELPDSLKEFSNINAATVATGRDFDLHMAQLIDALDRRLAKRASSAGAQ
jgi:hypothetical protein